MAVQGLLDGGSVPVCRMKAFAVAAAFANSSVAWYALMTCNPDEGSGAFPDVELLANTLGVVCVAPNSFKL